MLNLGGNLKPVLLYVNEYMGLWSEICQQISSLDLSTELHSSSPLFGNFTCTVPGNAFSEIQFFSIGLIIPRVLN